MARAASSSGAAAAALLLACALLAPAGLRADYQDEERAAAVQREDADLWQVVFGEHVVSLARRFLGRPYVWGGADPEKGFDCSGYAWYVFRTLGVTLPRTALAQFQQGIEVERGALLPGDLVFFTGEGAPLHVGIYEGRDRFLEAPGSGKSVQEASLDAPSFSRRFLGARRVTLDLDAERRRRAAAAARTPASAPETAASGASGQAP